MKKVTLVGFYRNELLSNIITNDFKSVHNIPEKHQLYNIRITKTGRTTVKEHDDLGPYWEELLFEYKITVLFKEEI